MRNKTEQEALASGMGREDDLEQKSSHCPECGCPWYANKNLCGQGARVCYDCLQDWFTCTKYDNHKPLRELPKTKQDAK